MATETKQDTRDNRITHWVHSSFYDDVVDVSDLLRINLSSNDPIGDPRPNALFGSHGIP
jgi:hypothetical protein